MNKTHRIVWSDGRQGYVVTHENAAARGKPAATKVLTAVMLVVGSASALPAWAVCDLTGSGTSSAPYQVSSAVDLAKVGVADCALTSHYLQTADITLDNTLSNNLTRIGSGQAFTGVYDGGGFKITGLRQTYTNPSSNSTIGLFGRTNTGAQIKHLTLDDAQISVSADASPTVNLTVRVGLLVGQLNGTNTSITNVKVMNSTVTVSSIGGNDNSIADEVNAGVIGHSQPTGVEVSHVHASNVTIQGAFTSTIRVNTRSLMLGTLVGRLDAGNFSSVSGGGSVSASHSANHPENKPYVGGLIGQMLGGTVSDAYSTASVSVTAPSGVIYWGMGGAVGVAFGGTLNRIYAAGAVNGAGAVGLCTTSAFCGGLVGRNVGTTNNSYWDTQTTGWATSGGNLGTGKTTAEMKTAATFTGAGWNDITVWNIQDGAYPTLRAWVPPNAAPTATSVAITGTAQVGTQLSGGYTYADADSNAEGTSTFRWVRNSVNTGVIGGTDVAMTINYTPVDADRGKYLYFCVTPVAATGTSPGTEACSAASAQVPTNAAPTASSVAITGTAQVGTQLTGSYTYADADSDAQGTSTFRWVRNSANTGVGGGTNVATTQNYTPATADVGKYLYFCATPVASAGTSPGTEVCSSASSAVIDDDQDGVSPSIEDGVPNATGSGTGDGNGDSVPDSQQVHVASLPTASSGGYATLESVGVKSLTSVAAIAVPSDVPGGVSNAPYGAFSFTANGVADNASETFKLYLPLDNSITGALKKNRVTNRWDSIGSVSHTTTKTIVTFTLENGGPYDADGSGTNGQIQDPIVPVMSSSTGPISIPTLSEWGMIILSGLLALGTFVTMRKRRV